MPNQWSSADHALKYLEIADKIPHRIEGEGVVLDQVSKKAQRILDLGTGSGRLLALLKIDRPQAQGVALDFSPVMLDAVKTQFADDDTVQVIAHNLELPLPSLGSFDVVVSSFAIHHLSHERKRSLYQEIFALLEPGEFFVIWSMWLRPRPKFMSSFGWRSVLVNSPMTPRIFC
jgi:tRNA (cmo5U34)-methyltransferase